jgi:hypothetical protein
MLSVEGDLPGRTPDVIFWTSGKRVKNEEGLSIIICYVISEMNVILICTLVRKCIVWL